jgi:hypothetical protein
MGKLGSKSTRGLAKAQVVIPVGRATIQPVGWGELANPNALLRRDAGSTIRGLINDRLDGR